VSLLDVRVSVSKFGADSYAVAVGGELDPATIEPLRERLGEVIDQGALRVLVDLTGVTFIESTALGVLVDAAKSIRSAGGQMVLVADDPRITRIIEITGLQQILRVEDSLAEGVEELVRRPR